MKFWTHYVPFALLAFFAVVELGMTGEWVANQVGPNNGRVKFAVFVSVWTFLGMLGHWALPFLVAAIWVIWTAVFWIIAGAVLVTAPCNVNGRGYGHCVSDSGRWGAMVSFAFMNMIFALAVLPCFWWHISRKQDSTWRDGVYGHNYFRRR